MFAAARRTGDVTVCTFLAHSYGMGKSPGEVFAEHRAFWKSPHSPPPLGTLMGVHTPPCRSQAGCNAFHALSAIGYNLLTYLKLAELPDEAQTWSASTVIRNVLTVPGERVYHANRQYFRLACSTPESHAWWDAIMRKYGSKGWRRSEYSIKPGRIKARAS
jgi:hypothetical protein